VFFHIAKKPCFFSTTFGSLENAIGGSRSLASVSSKKGGNQKAAVPTEIWQEGQSDNISLALALWDSWNNFTSADDMMAHFVSEESAAIAEDHPPIPARATAEGIGRLHASFPEIKFAYKSIEQKGPDRVVIEGIRCSGTHTGVPYSMVPGVFPAIEATGIACINDEERFWFNIKDNKIDTLEVVALGTLSGPAGFYEQIGGKCY
jgi:hypothetical protein